MNKIHVISPLIGILLVSCGGGGGSGPLVGPSTADDVVNTDVLLNNNGCGQEYYQTMIGRYTGMVEFAPTADRQAWCTWNETVILSGNAIGPTCDIRAETSGTVEQQIYTDSSGDSFQCLDDNGRRLAIEPLNGTYPIDEYPNLDNSNFPVEIDIFSNNNIDSGPFYGDENNIVRYYSLFDGRDITDHVVVEGDGTMTLRAGGLKLGTLTKVAQQ